MGKKESQNITYCQLSLSRNFSQLILLFCPNHSDSLSISSGQFVRAVRTNCPHKFQNHGDSSLCLLKIYENKYLDMLITSIQMY